MISKEIIEHAKQRLLFEIGMDASYIYSKLHGSVEYGDELDIADISNSPRFAVEEIGYLDGKPYSKGTHYIWKIRFTPNGVVFCYADNEGELPFELSVEELGRICDLCANKRSQLVK